MHVLHLVPSLFGVEGVFGGAERYVFELARHMADCTPTTLVTFGDRGRRESVGQLSIRVIGRPFYPGGRRDNPIAFGLLSELRRADIVHCHQQHVVASSLSAFICGLIRRPVFVTDLGGGGWDISSYISTDGWYDGHLHISNYSRKVSGHANKPFAHVIYGGTDTIKFSPDAAVTRERTVLYAGRLLPHKGINYLVDAVPQTVNLRLIGHEADQRFLADLRRLARGKAVSFERNCDDTELITAYRRASCAVLPSVYRDMYGGETNVPELLGQTLIEAMACGTPVICTAVSSMPEVVTDGETGFVVAPNDPEMLRERICWLLEHPSEAATMGRAARQRVLKQFTWLGVVERCLAIYRSRDQ